MNLTPGRIFIGKVVEIKEDMMMNRVLLDIGNDEIITMMVTGEALKELGAQVGDELEVRRDTGVAAAAPLH
jgi:molybdopterin-binding protein